MSYKLSGTASGDSSPKDVCQEQDRSVSTNEDRQHDSSCLYQQSGRDNIQRADSPDPEPMDVVPGEEYPHPSTIPTWSNEPGSRHGIEIHEGSIRLENVSLCLSDDRQDLWSNGSGPVCIQVNQCRRYFSWRPDPFTEATDAFLQDWTTVKGFRGTWYKGC